MLGGSGEQYRRERRASLHTRRSRPRTQPLPLARRPGDVSSERDHRRAARYESATILRGRYEDPKATVQLLVPKQVIAETLDLVFRVKHFFDAQALLVGVPRRCCLRWWCCCHSACGVGEMETMFKIGCARWMIFRCKRGDRDRRCVGVAIAVALTWLIMAEARLSRSSRHTLAWRSAARRPVAKPRVAVVNYPLWYFTKRIAGRSRRYHLSRSARG